ncbi:hypothetical protein CANARDRAFT_25198 [[Candida] arabinofermentans NRRL YB-2248]|uniref:Ubiquinol-cytochrome c chaperone domain-containing protein n=1 Tax=[Candida] arabinofermentans NRRL YB-2248 TaxID=983967 RepID=A0A1E4SUM4_9ASCO|nr:hypothetical protein CANARDRAFT_25198 [[Candida] arabinofermentans NRRL YB-2248]
MLQSQIKRSVSKNGVISLKYLVRFQSTDKTSPKYLANKSSLPIIENPEMPKRDIDPKRKLDEPILENPNLKLSKWKKALGESVISILRIDMDNVRGGTIGGSKYYYMSKEQGLQFKNEQLSETASFWYETLGLPRTFSQWFQITTLHIWILFVRMRALPFKESTNYKQRLVDSFFKDIELKLSEEMNVQSGNIRDNYMKDFHAQLRGFIFSFDEALATKSPSESDVLFTYSIWRNIFNGDKNVDIVKLESVLRYIRMQLYVLDKISDRAFGFGDFEFVSPNETVEKLSLKEEEEMKIITKNRYEPEGVKLLPSLRSRLSMDE